MNLPTTARHPVVRLLVVVLVLGLSHLGMSAALFGAVHDGGASSRSTPHKPDAFDAGMVDVITTLRGPNRAHAVASASRALGGDHGSPVGILPVSPALPSPMPLAVSTPTDSLGVWVSPPPASSDRAPPRPANL